MSLIPRFPCIPLQLLLVAAVLALLFKALDDDEEEDKSEKEKNAVADVDEVLLDEQLLRIGKYPSKPVVCTNVV